ncbi:hypothetical protein TWF192_010755 [Orbilia oligospora]|uniref:Uncharacterized protein n=2 Tax=Orbilia oligospora TaxID=2813651 RepID=A0A6G1LYG7_ORBOL|nr:hypothetical protein TWF679_005099 [Orbilia oligospora]KAF3197985.1 hypothetical protein TWF191_005174 [Orbilia oligospora]KAF3237749.1 hypothetical protein TWF192_010755 [Orbilia oligospora]
MQPIAIFAAAAAAFLSSVPQVSAHTRFPECKNLLVTPTVKIPAPGYDPSIPMVPSGPLVKQQFDTTVFSTSPIPTDPSSPHYKYAVMISNMMVEGDTPAGWAHMIKNCYMRPFDAETLTQTQSLTQQLRAKGKDISRVDEKRPGLPLQIAGFQINKDGGGPYRCKLDYTGSGQSFGPWLTRKGNIYIKPWVVMNGNKNAECSGASGEAPECVGKQWGILVDIPKPLPMQCRGAYGVHKNICILRSENEAKNGPFGGCWPVQIEPPPGLKPPKTRIVVNTKTPEPIPKYGDAGYDVQKDSYDEGAKAYY